MVNTSNVREAVQPFFIAVIFFLFFLFFGRKGVCVDPLTYFQFCELKVYESNVFCFVSLTCLLRCSVVKDLSVMCSLFFFFVFSSCLGSHRFNCQLFSSA